MGILWLVLVDIPQMVLFGLWDMRTKEWYLNKPRAVRIMFEVLRAVLLLLVLSPFLFMIGMALWHIVQR